MDVIYKIHHRIMYTNCAVGKIGNKERLCHEILNVFLKGVQNYSSVMEAILMCTAKHSLAFYSVLKLKNVTTRDSP